MFFIFVRHIFFGIINLSIVITHFFQLYHILFILYCIRFVIGLRKYTIRYLDSKFLFWDTGGVLQVQRLSDLLVYSDARNYLILLAFLTFYGYRGISQTILHRSLTVRGATWWN